MLKVDTEQVKCLSTEQECTMAAYDFVSTTTAQHTITIKDGSLTITGSDMTLLPDETEELLNTVFHGTAPS
jgi:hypothetical protein